MTHSDATDPGSLSWRQERAVLACLEHGATDAAAAASGVHPSTLWRWRQQPAFREALAAARREAFSQATTRLAAASVDAAETLHRICIDPEAPASIRVWAARCILERSAAAIELTDLAERLAALEDRTATKGAPQ